MSFDFTVDEAHSNANNGISGTASACACPPHHGRALWGGGA